VSLNVDLDEGDTGKPEIIDTDQRNFGGCAMNVAPDDRRQTLGAVAARTGPQLPASPVV